MRSVKAAAAIRSHDRASSQDTEPDGARHGLIRQSPALVTIGAIKPGSQKQRTARTALAAPEPQPGKYVSPRTTDYARTSVAELAARPGQADRSL